MTGNEPTSDPFSDFRSRDLQISRFALKITFFRLMIVFKIIFNLLNPRRAVKKQKINDVLKYTYTFIMTIELLFNYILRKNNN